MSTNQKNTSEKPKIKRPVAKKSEKQERARPSDAVLTLIPFVLVLIAFFLTLSLFATSFTGWLGEKVKLVLAGLFSWGSYSIPLLLVIRAFSFKKEAQAKHPAKNWIFSFIFVISLSSVIAAFGSDTEGFNIAKHFTSSIANDKITPSSLFGGITANAFDAVIGSFSKIVLLALLITAAPCVVEKSPAALIKYIGTQIARLQKQRKDKKKKKPIKVQRTTPPKSEEKPESVREAEAQIPIELDRDDDDGYDGDDADDIIGPVGTPVITPVGEYNEDSVDAELTIDGVEQETSEIELGTEPDDETVPDYVFPPVHLLKKAPPMSAEMNEEYENTAKKLVDTLASFGVKTKVINIAKGPTVTRYELQLEVGVRVRAIRNLADDISLSLAAKGVRIEAPIPGKEAVGIEVPNKTTSVVSIRSLIEADTFTNAKSRLTTCLGVDVAGNAVYCDIAKMPHMMIAGTTGSGKSVCINSILMSILYKAKPDEVKLILIDPKKIELGVYNGISHLLVPVVSDPKNAAGALAWSVNEMERRFALIEETGVREIKAYNEVALRDGKEVLPHIVIIIDELADLMMMARDTVEHSIARIAQKARAAGMHLIIGTQRPSVDVITGLIKANVPSRIAFTVASQIDSRTIIDTVGAEKLVGKGDMLYSPVGAMTPTRVQGSFVSDSEIEAVISFLKNTTSAQYDEEVIESIEKEALKCDKPKSKSFDGEDAEEGDGAIGSDPMLRSAIEIAIDSGTISTSMLQRKLKLGYARAARLIDEMEQMGVVSEFAGSKPRTVLISYEKYLEMVANSEN